MQLEVKLFLRVIAPEVVTLLLMLHISLPSGSDPKSNSIYV